MCPPVARPNASGTYQLSGNFQLVSAGQQVSYQRGINTFGQMVVSWKDLGLIVNQATSDYRKDEPMLRWFPSKSFGVEPIIILAQLFEPGGRFLVMMREGVCFGIGLGKRKSKIRPKTDNAVKKTVASCQSSATWPAVSARLAARTVSL
jgi:hypothetical protein